MKPPALDNLRNAKGGNLFESVSGLRCTFRSSIGGRRYSPRPTSLPKMPAQSWLRLLVLRRLRGMAEKQRD